MGIRKIAISHMYVCQKCRSKCAYRLLWKRSKRPRIAAEAAEWAESPALAEAAGEYRRPPIVGIVEQRVQVKPRVVPQQFHREFLHQRTVKVNLTIRLLYHFVLIWPAARPIDDVGRKSWAW